jgi:hypothetical protein
MLWKSRAAKCGSENFSLGDPHEQRIAHDCTIISTADYLIVLGGTLQHSVRHRRMLHTRKTFELHFSPQLSAAVFQGRT